MNELYHYSSKYYDPKKAHEYYEAHKQLKGRNNSTTGLTEEGKSIAKQVKDNLTAERKALIAANRDKTKAEINEHVHKVQLEAAKLRILLQSGSLKNDPAKKNEARQKLKSLVEETQKKREELLTKFKEDTDALMVEYEQKYGNELDRIREEYTKQKVTKASSSFGSSRSSGSSNSSISDTSEIKSKPTQESESSEYIPIKKEQTSKWAKNREKRREKAKRLSSIQHSDESESRIDSIVNCQYTMDEVIKRNNKSDNRIADLDSFIQSL